MDEANLGRPIPQKVKDSLNQCGSAILIFTCDEKFMKEDGTVATSLSRYRLEGLGVAAAVLLGGVAAHMVE